MRSLQEKLTQKPVREDSGARTAARYRYQALFGLALVFERHALDGDYAVVFEFHDDIAVLDSSTEPKAVRFYQVKTKATGEWTTALLTARKKSKKKDVEQFLPSIVGKMYDNVIAFGDEIVDATFVSNASAKFHSSKSEFCFEECSEQELERLKNKLKAEFPAEAEIRTDLLRFHRSDLSLEDADTHVKGKLEDFVTSQIGEVSFSVSALFRAVSDECVRKSQASTNLTNFGQVVKDRGITRNDAEGWLSTVGDVVDCPSWDSIHPQLKYPALEVVRIGREWSSYRISVLNPNEAIRRVRREIRKTLELEHAQTLDLSGLVDYVFNQVAEFARVELYVISDPRIKAMVLYEAYSNKEA